MKRVIFALLLLCANAQATTLDWSANTWTAGSLTNSYNFDSSNAGNDITVSISGDTSRFVSGNPVSATNPYTGGLSGSALQSDLNFSTRTQSVTYDFIFNYAQGVGSLMFALYDIDRNGTRYIDQISGIQGVSMTGGLVAPVITTSLNNTYSGGNVRGTGLASNTSSTGTVTFSFTNVVSEVYFTYGNSSSAKFNPAQQGFGIGNITYVAVPEPTTLLAGALLCALLARRYRS